jgi:hypothetical protein
LSGGESHNLEIAVISEVDIEVMKIPSGSTHNDGSFPHKHISQNTFMTVRINILYKR